GSLQYLNNEEPEIIIGNSKNPYRSLDGNYGGCVIGGGIYRGNQFISLDGKYIFGDFRDNKLMAIETNRIDSEPEVEVLIDDIRGLHETMPEGAGITAVSLLPDGSILISVIGSRLSSTPGKIYKLKRAGAVPEPPYLLSQIGAFTDLNSLTPVPGLIPYRPSAQLWSDHAIKNRWMAIPNNGLFDDPSETVVFDRNSKWSFPPGTVFIKNFELQTRLNNPDQTTMLETRFFIIGEEQSYGLSYHWNEEGTEAYLASDAEFRQFEIFDEHGNLSYIQRWDYPSRGQCMSCHTSVSNFVLGVTTHQLNNNYYYPELGFEVNQLIHLEDLGVFDQPIGQPDNMPKAVAINDEQADLGVRIRSYLDANCASCHRPGGIPTVNMDLRFNTPLFLSNIINAPNLSNASDPDGLVVMPGFHEHSQLWIRDNSLENIKMPPIGRNLVDQYYVDKLAEWIDGMPTDFTSGADQNYLYPNPTSDWINIRIRDDWELPVDLTIHSIDGRVIHQAQMEVLSDYMDLSILPAGTYIFTLNNQVGDRETNRIVVR
ncbi:MAG: T9SS type A sorting domain-containing protein, partial [Bacteroidota bacterium]